ncbi:type ISP restriction/modification enzyme [Spirillospora sp. NPDC049652]
MARPFRQLPPRTANAALTAFANEVAQKSGRGGEAEDQLRGPLERLLRELGALAGIEAVPYGEVRLKDLRARPDYAVDVGRVRVGYLELKAPGKGVPTDRSWGPTKADREQWAKLQALPNVLYTDGLAWGLYSFGELRIPIVRIAESRSGLRRPSDTAAEELKSLVYGFLLWEPEAPRTLGDLVKIMAGLCLLLKEEVIATLADPSDRKARERLSLLADDWRTLLFPGLDNEQFADAFAQTVTFALLLARSDGIDISTGSYAEIARQLTKRHQVMGQAFAVLTGGGSDELQTIDTLRRMLAVSDLRELDVSPIQAYNELYARFLGEYDPQLRRGTGSYYTPGGVARSIVGFTDEVLRLHLGKERGFADDDVMVIDAAMGTGAFLVEVVSAVARRVGSALGRGAREEYVKDLLRKRLIGFEIQVAPYAVAELRIHGTFRSLFGIEAPIQELRFLTDALANPHHSQQPLGSAYRVMEKNRDEANRLKRDVPVMVVIGNPPHVENARGRAPWIEERRGRATGPAAVIERPSLDEFRAPGMGRYESDLHGMPWYFLRWAAWKVFEAHPQSDAGVVAYVLPSSVVKSRAFCGLREYLRRTCALGWVIELSPEGNRPPMAGRIFGPQVGRKLCVLIFARPSGTDEQVPARVHYVELHGTRAEKESSLRELRTTSPEWRVCDDDWQSPFLPAADSEWTRHPALADLMPWRSRGVTPGRTWVYAPSPETLRERWRHLISAPVEQRRRLFRESRDRTLHSRPAPLPGFPPSQRNLAEEHGPARVPVRVAYRSFDRQWLIPDSRILEMPRPALWRVRSDDQIFVSEQDAHEISVGPALIFPGLIPDLHHYNGRGGGVRPLWRDPSTRSPNLAPGLLTALEETLGLKVTAVDVLAYIGALTAHPAYTARFSVNLQRPGVRVPLSADPVLWRQAVELGRDILWLHSYGTRCVDPPVGRGEGDFAVIERFGIRVDSPVRELPTQLPDQLPYDERTQSLLVGEGAFRPVPPGVINYQVSGRRIVWRWLNDRTARPRNKRRTSELDDIVLETWEREFTVELLALLSVLTGCVRLEPRQADLLTRVVQGPLITTGDLTSAGVLPVLPEARRPSAGGMPGTSHLAEP